MLLHHTGKVDKESRGSSGIKAGCDALWVVSSLSHSGHIERLRFDPKKSRLGGQEFTIHFDETSKLWISEASEPVRLAQSCTLPELLFRNPGISCTAFETNAHKYGHTRNAARDFLGTGVAAGKIARSAGPGGSFWHNLVVPVRQYDNDTLRFDVGNPIEAEVAF